jgi:hypothetical protein
MFHGRSDIAENTDLRFLCPVPSTLRPRIVHPDYDICDLLCLPKLRLQLDGHLLHEVLLEHLLYRQQIDLLLRLLLRGLAVPLEYGAMPVDRM